MTGDGGRGFSAAGGGRRDEGFPLRRGREFGRGMFRSCGSDLLSQRGERRQRRARGTSSEHTSLAPFPQNRNTAKTTYRSVAPPHSAREGSPLGTCALPLQIETYHFDLRRTFRRNLQASSLEGTRRAAVGARSIWERELRRIPVNKDAAAAPLRSPKGLRRSGDPAKGFGMGPPRQAYARRRLSRIQHIARRGSPSGRLA